MFKKSFWLLFLGQSLANTGDVFYIVAVISAVYHSTGSSFYTGAVPIMFVIAQTVSGLLAPFLFQRVSLTRALLLSQAGKTILLGLLAIFLAFAGGENQLLSGQDLSLVLGFVFVTAFLDGWALPARNALVPGLVSREGLVKANGMLAASDQTVQFAGWAAGGLFVAWLGYANVLLATFGAFVLATLAILPLGKDTGSTGPVRELADEKENVARDDKAKGSMAGKKEAGYSSCEAGKAGASDHVAVDGLSAVVDQAGQEHSGKEAWATGWWLIWKRRRVRLLVLMEVLEGLAGAVWMAAILLPYVLNILGKGEEWWGYINAAYMLGAIAGGALVVALANRMRSRLPNAVALGILASGLITLLFGFSTWTWGSLLLSFLLGPFYQMQLVAKQTMIQEEIPAGSLPLVLSAKGTLDSVTFGVSVLLMGGLADWMGVRSVYLFAAVLLGLAAGLSLLMRKYGGVVVAQEKGKRLA
ncbi:MFS transporter [Brevibacillus ruminantium]|uniref:MFS transporter n=1 Tax=Brevibacillus ruminantium TaxID=2950604 RepID=A0ABY4WC32_9BACL|nr:MFS transporter [Brevibacillus ruminantium]USG64738.1 MFS transporter [Brevibacillus ruminantium]